MSQIEVLSESMEIDGPPPVEGYRAISPLAITALGLGLLSIIAVFSPLLGFIPLAAMAIGCYALRQISVNSERLSGRWIAVAALVLASLFLGWGMSREFSRREQVYRHAREFANDWLGILNRKETYFAHQLKKQSSQRLDLHANLQAAYQSDETATMDLKGFIEYSPTKDILAAAPDVRFHFEEFCHHQHDGFTDTVTMQYTYETPSSGKNRFWVTTQRTYSNYTGRADWRISDISILKPHSN